MKIFSNLSYSVRDKYKNHQMETNFASYTRLDNKALIFFIFFHVLIIKTPLKKLLLFGKGKEKSLYFLFPNSGSIFEFLLGMYSGINFFVPELKNVKARNFSRRFLRRV